MKYTLYDGTAGGYLNDADLTIILKPTTEVKLLKAATKGLIEERPDGSYVIAKSGAGIGPAAQIIERVEMTSERLTFGIYAVVGAFVALVVALILKK